MLGFERLDADIGRTASLAGRPVICVMRAPVSTRSPTLAHDRRDRARGRPSIGDHARRATPARPPRGTARSFATMPARRRARAHERITRPHRRALASVAPVGVEHAGGGAGNQQPRRAIRRAARLPASVSAFTLNSRPSARGADAGHDRHVAAAHSVLISRRAARTSARRPGRGSTISPLVGFVRRRRLHRRTPASAPVSPTAGAPAALIAATSRVLIEPASTATTTSQRRLVGDAQPVDLMLRNRRLRERRVDSRPPPCTTTSGAAPRHARRCARPAPLSARRDPRAARRRSFRRRRPSGSQQTRPLVESHITLKFCTADPAAPFNRLSMTDTTRTRPVGLVDLPADVAEVRPRDVLDFRQRRRR